MKQKTMRSIYGMVFRAYENAVISQGLIRPCINHTTPTDERVAEFYSLMHSLETQLNFALEKLQAELTELKTKEPETAKSKS